MMVLHLVHCAAEAKDSVVEVPVEISKEQCLCITQWRDSMMLVNIVCTFGDEKQS